MTHDQAKQILRDCGGNIQMLDGVPDWRADLVVMDGVFSVDELRAVLWFAEQTTEEQR
ncbi:hypothetical protein [Paraburkholderia elongata]|uniref:Uncharacterized protein n=1 Tax=Paraburkholderia elongata TaxID=2675747 RepID=A0A972NV57_9BURK|nr:hypothetical protein [Paraburkholderia elongata]NPT59033.1 hypothetical protein [Paraburkholderia elongata]